MSSYKYDDAAQRVFKSLQGSVQIEVFFEGEEFLDLCPRDRILRKFQIMNRVIRLLGKDPLWSKLTWVPTDEKG